MFNAMSPAQLTAVLSGVLREGADWSRPLDGFQRGQLKSASSIGRHLASELAGGPAVAARFRADLRALLTSTTDGAQPHGRSGAEEQQRGCARSFPEPAGAGPGPVADTTEPPGADPGPIADAAEPAGAGPDPVTDATQPPDAEPGPVASGSAGEVADAAHAVVVAIDEDPSGDVAALGGPIGDLLTAARAAGAHDLAAAVRVLLRDLVDAEIDLLSTPVTATLPTGGSR